MYSSRPEAPDFPAVAAPQGGYGAGSVRDLIVHPGGERQVHLIGGYRPAQFAAAGCSGGRRGRCAQVPLAFVLPGGTL